MSFTLISAILVVSLPMTLTDNLSYKVLEDLGASCAPSDTCAVGKRSTLTSPPNCQCDHLCVEYKDCCIDNPYRNQGRSLGLSCKNTGAGKGVYVFDKCPLHWRGSADIKRKCERRNSVGDDPMAEAPVTDSETDVTYRNSYCAHCNGARGPYHHWNSKLVCESLTAYNQAHGNITGEYIRNNLARSSDKKKWGVKLWSGDKNQMVFYDCAIDYEVPALVTDSIRSCTPNVVSKCNPGWARDSVHRLCESSYMAVIFVNHKAYRNPHCALCNFESVADFKCQEQTPQVGGGVDSRRRQPMSFSLLLDVNSSDGNTVGETNNCPKDQIYDPYFKKCRPMMCAIPGYVIRHGKCVPP